ncbi:MAG: LysR family transcriptional regulator [Desulfovibrio sp.]|nr:LysR family transcriptional regulator [Desulfovibrio sp.]
MELRDLRTFAAVARLLSFHRAAAELNAAQSTVSARIAALETELGVRLFERLGRRVALTEAGERLVQYAAKLIDVEDEARAWVTGESRLRGLLTVRVPESLCAYRLPPVIAAFRRRHPEVALHLTACTLNGLEKDLRQGITDLAFVMADSVRGGDLNVEALGMEPLVLVAAPHHPLATRERVAARDLHGATLVLSTADCAYRRVIEEALAAEGVQPSAGLEFSSAAALRGCVASGVGVTLLPVSAVRDELRAGTLRALAWAEQPFETAVLMVRHRGKWVSPYMDTFMELCRTACGEAAGTGAPPEAIWDFPCPMADVATILEPPKPVPDTDERPGTADQPLATDVMVLPSSPSLPDTPGTPDAGPETAPDRAPYDHPDMRHGTWPDAEPEAQPHARLHDHLPGQSDDFLHGQSAPLPAPDSAPWSEPWSDSLNDQELMDDADTGPETVWGSPMDRAPEMDVEMAPEMEPDVIPDVPWAHPDGFSGLALADEPCADGDHGPDICGDTRPGNGMDMPLHAPEPVAPAGAAPEQVPHAVPPASGMAPETRHPSLWDMPETSGQPPVSAVPAPAAGNAEESGTPTVPPEPPMPTEGTASTESAELAREFEPAILPDGAGQTVQSEGVESPDLADQDPMALPGGQAATPQEPTRPAPPERLPEPAPEAPQWLSLLPPKR